MTFIYCEKKRLHCATHVDALLWKFVPEKGVVLGAFSRTIMETQIKLPLLSQPLFYSFSQKHEFPLLVAMPILHAVLSKFAQESKNHT